MFCRHRGVILGISMLFLSIAAYGQDITKEQIKGQDEQVQEIKSDVLSIAAELNQLEEKLMYPSNTEVSVFVSMKAKEDMRLDSIEIQIDGKPVATHIYSFKELDAIKKGGVQRIFTGNITTGAHDMKVTAKGKTGNGSDFTKTENFKVNKDVSPKIVEVALSGQGISFKDR